MDKKTIFVLGGGNSSEKNISAKSAKFVFDSLSNEMYHLFLIMITPDRWYVVTSDNKETDIDKNDFSFTVDGKRVKPDYILNVIHGTPGENGLLQGYFDLLNIPQLGCSALTSAVTFDKVWCKRLAAEYGVAMAKDFIIYKGDSVDTKEIVNKLGLPIFIKPSNSGSSFGVTKVKCEEDILAAIDIAFLEDDIVIIEEAIIGREMACGVYITNQGAKFLPVTEIISENEFFDFEAKYQGKSKEVTPAEISEDIRQNLEEISIKLYKAFRCHGVIRIDYIVRDGIPYLIEPNTIPGMSEQSIIPQQLEVCGLSVNDLYTEIMNY